MIRSRVVVVAGMSLALACFMTTVPAGATTVVTGAGYSSDVMTIDPTGTPADPVSGTVPATALKFVVQASPSVKVINSVTLGDLAMASSCSTSPPLRLYVRESVTGNPSNATQIAYSTNMPPAPASLGRVTWTLPPTTMIAGRTYVFAVESQGTCTQLVQRTWAHNAATVNGGTDVCQGGPTLESGAAPATRVWHEAGSNALDCGLSPSTVDGALASGWYPVACSGAFSGNCIPGASIVPNPPPGVTLGNPCQIPGYDLSLIGGTTVFWKFDGTMNNYKCAWTQWAPPTAPVTDGWYYAQPWRSDRNGAPRDMFFSASLDKVSLARWYRPIMRFDSSEDWRPLNVDSFLAEKNGNKANHKVCVGSTCWNIASAATLAAHNSTTAKINIAGTGSESTYKSPNTACNSTSHPTRECDTGAATAVYYALSPSSPTGYRYLDYWLFYRYNFFGSVPVANDFNHEADWENVTVATSQVQPGSFDYATFSQHGKYVSYLRDILRCDGNQSANSCNGATRGRRVTSYVAMGTHANYPDPCSEVIPLQCGQSQNALPERGHDGSRLWGVDGSDANLLALPASGWSTWLGSWGTEGGATVNGPAAGDHASRFTTPWSSPDNVCNSNDPCALPARVRKVRSERERAASVCAAWFGSGVTATACDPFELPKAIRRARLLRRGAIGLRRLGRSGARVASSGTPRPAVAQLGGNPLRAREQIEVRAHPGHRLELSVNFAGNGKSGTARFRRVPVSRISYVRLVKRRGAWIPILVSSGEEFEPTKVFMRRSG